MDHRVEAFWDRAYDKFGFGAGVQAATKRGIRRSLCEELSSLLQLENLGPELSQSVLCESYSAVCVIAAPRRSKGSVEHCGRVGIGRSTDGNVQVTVSP